MTLRRLSTWAGLALALVWLHASLAFANIWPTLGIRLNDGLSLDAGLALLALQPPLWFRGVSPWNRLWGSHTWGGLLLIALLLFAMAAAPEIRSRPTWRRLHTAAAFLTALLLAVQAISGSRDLLVLGLGVS